MRAGDTTQLRTFVGGPARIREEAAADLAMPEAAVSLHVGQLRRDLRDRLIRTGAGLGLTPGGLRLASRGEALLGP